VSGGVVYDSGVRVSEESAAEEEEEEEERLR
jgi:hypothetical protein